MRNIRTNSMYFVFVVVVLGVLSLLCRVVACGFASYVDQHICREKPREGEKKKET